MWTIYTIRWDFYTKLCGSTPADPEIVKRVLDARKPKTRPPNSRSIVETAEEILATLANPQEEEFAVNMFQRFKECCSFRSSTVKAHLKDIARVLSNQYIGRLEGERAFSTRVINGVYLDQYWIPILRQEDGSPFTEPSGVFEQFIHPRPGIDAIKCFQYCVDARMEFRLKVLTPPAPREKMKKVKDPETGQVVEVVTKAESKPSVSRDDLIALFDYGGVHGYAGERGNGEGRYIATILKEETE